MQSAVEFLMTYGWAILILIIVIGTLWKLGVFNLGNTAPNLCSLPADIGCVSAVLFPSGALHLNIQQATQYTINVVAVGCTTVVPDAAINVISPPNTISIGGNQTFTVQCYQGGNPFSAPIGQEYRGYIVVNYTDLTTGFLHTAQGTLIETVQ